ncbi:TonB-dependent receptor domain-containing protein [Leptobacterium sp. I13]|uniref:TonB-dependent receptor n=1 Tax=Leptobacterium meishanense TaxID=3128904 RepID=UPI0030ED83D1
MKYLADMNKINILFFFLSVQITCGQSVKIIDRETQEPLSNVAVYNQEQTKTIISDIEGNVDLFEFSETERIFFKLYGYNLEKLSKKQAIEKGKVYLYPKSEELDEVIISISKWEQQKRDIPQKITSVKSGLVTFSNPPTAADFLQNSGQVFVQKSQLGGGSPMIRGFSTNRLLLTIDGVRMNTAIFRGGNVQNVISIDPFNIQRTEVVFGAGSVIYGSDAVGGVMNFYTKAPRASYNGEFEIRSSITTRYATANDEKTGHIDLELSTEKWGFLSSVSYTDFGDLRMGNHGPVAYLRNEYVERVNNQDVITQNDEPRVQKPTAYDQINFLQKIKYTPNKKWDFNLGVHYSSTSDYARYDRLLRYRDGLPRSAEWYYGPQRWLMTNFQINKSGNGKLYNHLQLTTAYQHFEESRNDRDFQSDLLNKTKEKVGAYSVNLDFEKKIHEKTDFFYGLEYIYNIVDSEGNTLNINTRETAEAPSRYPDGATWQSFAAYANWQYKFRPNLTLLSGVRYSHVWLDADFDNTFFDFPFNKAEVNTGAFTGSVGISWLPEETLQITLNGTTAFRAPNVDDIGKIFDSEPGAVVVPNPDLKKEYAYNIEFGIRKNFYDKVMFSFTTFYTMLNDALVRRDFQLNGQTMIDFQGELSTVQAIQNAAKAKSYGFEFGLETYFSERLSFTSHLTITKGEEELDNGETAPLRHAAPLFGDAHLLWKNDRWKIDLFANYNGEIAFEDLAPSEQNKPFLYAIDENGLPFSPSWYTFNLRTQYRISEKIETNIALENITDQRYRSYSSGIAAPGRNLIISLKMEL